MTQAFLKNCYYVFEISKNKFIDQKAVLFKSAVKIQINILHPYTNKNYTLMIIYSFSILGTLRKYIISSGSKVILFS